jgi:hypothetical protein
MITRARGEQVETKPRQKETHWKDGGLGRTFIRVKLFPISSGTSLGIQLLNKKS